MGNLGVERVATIPADGKVGLIKILSEMGCKVTEQGHVIGVVTDDYPRTSDGNPLPFAHIDIEGNVRKVNTGYRALGAYHDLLNQF